MSQPATLASWFNATVIKQGAVSRNPLLLLVAVKVIRLLCLIGGYWFFATIMNYWVVHKVPAPNLAWALCGGFLAVAWALQGVAIAQTLRAKTALLGVLEARFQQRLVCEQRSLVDQHPVYYWQTLWTKHLSALVHWRYDYQVQQYVAVVTPLCALIAIFAVNGFIAFALLLMVPIVPLFMVLVGKGAAKLQQQHFVALTRLGSVFIDRVKALSLLATFRAHCKQLHLLKQASDELNARTMKVVGVAFLSNTVLDFFATIAVALVAVFIGFSLLGEFSLGPSVDLQQGLWILLTVPLLFAELKALGQFYHQKAEAEAAREVTGQWLTPVAQDWQLEPAATLRSNQNFRLVLDDGLLRTEHLTITPGDWVAVTGRSGSGKTLLIDALAGQRPSNYRLPCKVAMLTQQAVLLPVSIRDNLTYHTPASTEQLIAVLQAVALYDWVQTLPAGLDTQLDETPLISGGQAQRLSLARLLLCDAPVWLLDEPTAHLPQQQHEALCHLIRRLAVNKTLFWVSHKSLPKEWFSQNWRVEANTVVAR